jgi:hypothetical protein
LESLLVTEIDAAAVAVADTDPLVECGRLVEGETQKETVFVSSSDIESDGVTADSEVVNDAVGEFD